MSFKEFFYFRNSNPHEVTVLKILEPDSQKSCDRKNFQGNAKDYMVFRITKKIRVLLKFSLKNSFFRLNFVQEREGDTPKVAVPFFI